MLLVLQVLHVSRELPITITLQNIVSKAFPTEYATRAQEALAAAGAAAAAAGGSSSSEERLTLPLFVMSTLLPGEKIALNIFEPRWVESLCALLVWLGRLSGTKIH